MFSMSLGFCGVYVLRYESGILWGLCVEVWSGILWDLCVEA